ncbi:MAG TPA: penicillin-binding protein 1A [Thermodesulfovibrionales bacterium]|nr:penicillin-binding protein 1A [Thermodesulfovibrionales bacterium]
MADLNASQKQPQGEGLRERKRRREGYHGFTSKRTALFFFILISVTLGIAGGFIYWNLSDLPAIRSLEEYPPIGSSLVYSSGGKVLAEFYIERRTFTPHYRIPDRVKKAFIAIEDVRFYYHPGVDFIGILRALYQDIRMRSIAQGGSTITQQLAKMLFLKPERSMKRKIKEIALSIQIEKHYTKDEILGLYLNQAYFGTRAYGIEAAAQTYFGKTIHELTIGESALLASLPKAPSFFSPFKNPERARERRSVVLKQMLEHKFITRKEYEEAEREPLPTVPHFRKYDAPYFVEMLRHALETRYGNDLYTAGYKIYSTIDSTMQKAAEEAVANGIAALEKRIGATPQAALVAVDLRTGAVRAMVGGSDFWKNQFNRATQALRQPGSAFKPFVYLTAIREGMTVNDMILDAPLSFHGAAPGQIWSPKNYDGKYHGPVTLKTALAKSLNAATVRLAVKLGIENIIDTAQSLGIRSKLQPYLPIALGASDVTLFEMVSAYGTFATGEYFAPMLYEKILNKEDMPLEEKKPESAELLSAEDTDEMKTLLHAVVEEGTAQKAKELKRTLYGKTGTTNDFTDAWFIGFDDRLVVGVWTGRDDHKSLGAKETGAKAALPIWIEFMKKVPPQTPVNQNPGDPQSPPRPQ